MTNPGNDAKAYISAAWLALVIIAFTAGIAMKPAAMPEPEVIPLQTVPFEAATREVYIGEVVETLIPVTVEAAVESTAQPVTAISTATTEKASVEPTAPQPTVYDIALSEELQRYTYDVCAEYGVADQYESVLSMMYVESRYQPDVISRDGANYGLMQLNKVNGAWLAGELGKGDLLDARYNILCGVYMFAGYMAEYGDVTKALMCYNHGEAGAKRKWRQGVTSTAYTRAVLAHREGLHE